VFQLNQFTTSQVANGAKEALKDLKQILGATDIITKHRGVKQYVLTSDLGILEAVVIIIKDKFLLCNCWFCKNRFLSKIVKKLDGKIKCNLLSFNECNLSNLWKLN
jgi:hypothetical protein